MPRGRCGKKMRSFMRKDTSSHRPARSESHLEGQEGWNNRGGHVRGDDYCKLLIRVCKLCKIPLVISNNNLDTNRTTKKLVAFVVTCSEGGTIPDPEALEGLSLAFAEKMITNEDIYAERNRREVLNRQWKFAPRTGR